MVLLLMLLPCLSFLEAGAQVKDTTVLRIVSHYAGYRLACKKNPDLELVELKKVVPGLVLDIRYATRNNFMKQVMYAQARAFARRPVAAQLKKIQLELKTMGYGLKIFDAYRPYRVTVAFYRKAGNKAFVANPKKGSKHNRGCAVDLTLVDLKTGRELAMPTPYDSFEARAAPTYMALPQQVLKNRSILIGVMEKYGFRVIENEWWHFDFRGWNQYDLMDIPFEQL